VEPARSEPTKLAECGGDVGEDVLDLVPDSQNNHNDHDRNENQPEVDAGLMAGLGCGGSPNGHRDAQDPIGQSADCSLW
jgi:hypothetical protein